jgi:hypothetical protein
MPPTAVVGLFRGFEPDRDNPASGPADLLKSSPKGEGFSPIPEATLSQGTIVCRVIDPDRRFGIPKPHIRTLQVSKPRASHENTPPEPSSQRLVSTSALLGHRRE